MLACSLALAAALSFGAPAAGAPFLRGDANDDGLVDISDTIAFLGFLFAFGGTPHCYDAVDANDDGSLDISDVIKVLLFFFGGSSPLPAPSDRCGEDPTEDDLGCSSCISCVAIPHEALTEWLAAHPAVRQALIWWEPGRGWIDCDAWSEGLKGELLAAFDAAWIGSEEPLDPVPPNLLEYGDLVWPPTTISADAAKALYLSLAVRSLLAEVKGLVPWSLEAYGAAQLAILFDGRTLFRRNPYCVTGSTTAYAFQPEQALPTGCAAIGLQLESAYGLPAPGAMAFEFLAGEVGIGPSSRETIGNLLDWSRAHMLHFAGSFRADVAEYYWGYRGAPPAARILEGTDPPGFHPQSEDWGWPPDNGYQASFASWTAGCHGTMAFFRHVLRAVNIPVEYNYAAGHALPRFPGDDAYMSHGDDPYNLYTRTASYPGQLLLIDSATYRAWFTDPVQAKANVGRQVMVLAGIYLPTTLLKNRCQDLAQGLPPESGSVFQALKQAYSLEDLAAMGFWEKIDAEIARQGGCGAIH